VNKIQKFVQELKIKWAKKILAHEMLELELLQDECISTQLELNKALHNAFQPTVVINKKQIYNDWETHFKYTAYFEGNKYTNARAELMIPARSIQTISSEYIKNKLINELFRHLQDNIEISIVDLGQGYIE
jgi:hypothetical protein